MGGGRELNHLPHSLYDLLQGDFPLKADRVVQSVKAICNALAAVETPEITSALNQLPPCPSRMQPKIQKVRETQVFAGGRDSGWRSWGTRLWMAAAVTWWPHY